MLTNKENIQNMTTEELGCFLIAWCVAYERGKIPQDVFTWLDSEVE